MILEILEALGAIATISGAFLVSRGKERLMIFGLLSFIAANYFMFAFATGKGMLPLQVQMLFLFAGGIPAIKAYSKNWRKTRNILFIITVIYVMLMVSFFDFQILSVHISNLEVLAATLAVVGSYLLRYKNDDIKVISFFMFLIADVIYVYVSIEMSLLFFGLQSLFFWYTSIDGMRRHLNGESFFSWLVRQKSSLPSFKG